MWLSNNTSGYSSDNIKEPGRQNILYRSNSPPLEGGESLCEFYGECSEKKEKLKSLYINSLAEDKLKNLYPKFQNDTLYSPSEERFPNKDFALLNQDLHCSESFSETFLQSILSSVASSDPVVANAWMETLLDVVDLLPKEIIKGEILTLAVSKGQLSQPVSSRLLCCKMIGKICMKFDPYVVVKEVLPLVLSLCQDVDFEVRGHMCKQLALIAKGIDLEPTKSAILPELVELTNDEEIFVRLAGIETVVQMLPILDDATCKEIIIPLVKKFCENSLSVRDSTLPVVSKQLGQLCHGLVSNLTYDQKQWFLRYFQDLSKLGLHNHEKRASSQLSSLSDLSEADHQDHYQICRHACAFNFPAMVLLAGPENFEKDLYSTFKELCSDPFNNVRQTMASGFYEISRLLDKQACLLHSELVILLQDESIEVLKQLIPLLPDSLKIVCSKSESDVHIKNEAEKKLVKALLCCEEAASLTCSWRLHADFLSCLSCLPFCISPETIFDTFVPLLFVKLHTARPIPCRMAAAYSLLIFLQNTPGLERRKGIINEMIRELCYGKSCHKRMLFIRICELVMELFSKFFFKSHFFKPLLSLSADPVPNIRMRLCSVLPRLKSLLLLPKDSHLLLELESCVKIVMSCEKDKDVTFAVSKAIQELDKIEVPTDPMLLRSSTISLDKKDWQKENEGRQLSDNECNNKDIEKSKICKDTEVLENIVNKSGKIPVKKSGTLPKMSKSKMPVFDKANESSKSLRCIKEFRISSPRLNSDFQKSTSKNATQLNTNTLVQKTEASCASTKFSSSNSRSQTVTTHTWPRQKRASNIPKQSIDRCFLPKDLTSISSSQLNETKMMPPPASYNDDTKQRMTAEKSIKRRVKLMPALEVLRKSATFSNLNFESKIPTSSLKRRSMIKD